MTEALTTMTMPATEPLKPWPLMNHNINQTDREAVIQLLRQDDPMLTQSQQVEAFEREWSEWLGVAYSVFVNSGSSANLLTMTALRETHGLGEIIVPTLTWASDIASVIQCGFTPVFVDIDPRTLGMDTEAVLDAITPDTRGVFITHVLGFNALTERLLNELNQRHIPLIEDVCESHGATFNGQKLGSFGLMSNFSFYYAHHLSTIEGGMVSTDNQGLYEMLRMLRSHGMVREAKSNEVKRTYRENHPDLNPEFIFAFPAYNVRSSEINAVIGLSQLERLDEENEKRRENFDLFLSCLDSERYQTDFAREGSCNYALTLILKEPDLDLCYRIMNTLRMHDVEYRRGTAGGGNQLRQPYLNNRIGDLAYVDFPNVDHVHFYGFYIGNYPSLELDRSSHSAPC